MSKKPKPMPTAPDGEPRISPQDGGGSAKSKVSEMREPLIAKGAGKGKKYRDADEASVDEAGQIRMQRSPVDLLH